MISSTFNLSINYAMKQLEKLKNSNKKEVLVCTIDWDKDSESRALHTIDSCLMLCANEAATAVTVGDSYFTQIQLYTVPQNIKKVVKKGVMYNIIFT